MYIIGDHGKKKSITGRWLEVENVFKEEIIERRTYIRKECFRWNYFDLAHPKFLQPLVLLIQIVKMCELLDQFIVVP